MKKKAELEADNAYLVSVIQKMEAEMKAMKEDIGEGQTLSKKKLILEYADQGARMRHGFAARDRDLAAYRDIVSRYKTALEKAESIIAYLIDGEARIPANVSGSLSIVSDGEELILKEIKNDGIGEAEKQDR